MSQLCYPYGGGITCVCDEVEKIFKCFPDLEDENKKQKVTKTTEGNYLKQFKVLNILGGQ